MLRTQKQVWAALRTEVESPCFYGGFCLILKQLRDRGSISVNMYETIMRVLIRHGKTYAKVRNPRDQYIWKAHSRRGRLAFIAKKLAE